MISTACFSEAFCDKMKLFLLNYRLINRFISASSYEIDCLFKCDFCPNTFRSEDSFNVHILEHFDRKNCVKCNKLVIRIGSKWFEVHVDDVDDVDDRDDSYDQKNNLILNSRADIKVEICDESDNSNDLGNINDDKDFQEDDMNEEFRELDEYKSEVMKETKSRNDTKRKTVITKDQIKQTASIHTSESSQPRRKGRLARIKCRICDRHIIKYNFESHLQKMHVPRIVVPSEPIKCETCGKSFASSGNLKTHQSIHSGTKRFGMFNAEKVYFSNVPMKLILCCVFFFLSVQLLRYKLSSTLPFNGTYECTYG